MGTTPMRNRLSAAYRGFVAPVNQSTALPVSSFPFVSGDTFRQMSKFVFGRTGVATRTGLDNELCFASGPLATRADFVSRAEDLLASNAAQRASLLIHNGDKIPSAPVLGRLANLFHRVYAVNLVEESHNVRALPIGLENARLDNNGRLGYYLDGLEVPRASIRPRLVISSFHPSNNPGIREPVMDLFCSSRFGFDGHAWKRGEYRQVLKETCFVISPPGNGPDCHRTWEAVYLGAIPVVLKGHLAPSLIEDMPILPVQSYEEFLQLDDSELRAIYSRLASKPPSKAFATHWVRELS